MTQFEYCQYIFDKEKGVNTVIYNEVNVLTNYEAKMITIINSLGKEGWELVTTSFLEDRTISIFKRGTKK